MEHPAQRHLENAMGLLVSLLEGTSGQAPRPTVEKSLVLMGQASKALWG